jgi:DNA-directed RNA polymerase subunit RPC12/RpoP
MIISTLYRCDNCGKEANGTSRDMPESWAKSAGKDLCPTCIRIAGTPINNLSDDRLRKEIRFVAMSRRIHDREDI